MMVTARRAVNHDGNGAAYDDIDDDCDGAMGNEVNNNGNGVKLSSQSMHRRLSHCCNSVFALIMMALLPSPMRWHLAVVDYDGDGMTGDDNYDDFNNATNFAVAAMELLPSLRWRHCRCAGVLPLSTMMAMARWVTMLTMMTKE